MRSFSVGGGVCSKLASGPKHVWRAGMLRRRLRAALTTGITALVALASAGILLATGRIISVNRNPQGAPAAGNGSTGRGMSTDGRYVAGSERISVRVVVTR
jgi:hypothetical protein